MGRARWLLLGAIAVAIVTAVGTIQVREHRHGARDSARAEAPEGIPAQGDAAEESGKKGGESEEIRARDAWFYGQRAFPHRFTPKGALVRAQAQARGLRPARLRATLGPALAAAAPTTPLTWKALGPRPIASFSDPPYDPNYYNGTPPTSGRVTAIAVHPINSSIAYLGAAGGGLWKTTNGGTSWTPLFDHQPSLAVSAIAIVPSSPGTVYAGTGEANASGDSYYGAGIFKSANGGTTWAKIGGTNFDGCHVADIVAVGSIVVAAIEEWPGVANPACTSAQRGLWRSTNSGVDWTHLANPPGSVYDSPDDLAVDPDNSAVLYAGFSSDGVFKSTDTGATWSELGGGASPLPTGGSVGRVVVAAAKASQNVYAAIENTTTGDVLGVYSSPDSGATWSVRSYPSTLCNFGGGAQCWYDLVVAVDQADPTTFYVAGTTLVKFSSVSYSTLAFPDGIHVDFHSLVFDGANRLWLGNDGGIYRTPDGGSSFTNLNGNLSLTQFEPGISGGTARLLGGTQDNGTIRLTSANDDGAEIKTGDGGATALNPTNALEFYVSYVYTYIYKTTTGGASYAQVTPAGSTFDPVLFYPPLRMSPANSQRLLFGTNRVWETTTGASSWAPISPAFPAKVSSFGIAKSNAAVLYAGTSAGQLEVTTTGGASWTDTAPNGIPARYVTDIEVKPTVPGTAYATVSGFGSGHVFRTTNTGGTWTDVSGNLPNTPVNAIVADYRTTTPTLYVATDVGVFWSIDGGATWANTSSLLPSAVVLDLILDTKSNNLLAATHGRGIWSVAAPSESPVITSFTPTSGPTGTVVTITGKFFDYVNSVKFNGIAATFTKNSRTQLTATVPSGATTGPVRVASPFKAATSATNFMVTP